MAKIVEESLQIKFSRIVKNQDDASTSILGSDIQVALEQVAQELVGDGVVVEVEKV